MSTRAGRAWFGVEWAMNTVSWGAVRTLYAFLSSSVTRVSQGRRIEWHIVRRHDSVLDLRCHSPLVAATDEPTIYCTSTEMTQDSVHSY